MSIPTDTSLNLLCFDLEVGEDQTIQTMNHQHLLLLLDSLIENILWFHRYFHVLIICTLQGNNITYLGFTF